MQINGQLEGIKDRSAELREPVLEGNHESEGESPETEQASAIHDIASNGHEVPASAEMDADLTALVDERDSLREEVAQVRRSLKEAQGSHEEELTTIQEQLSESRAEKEQAEAQYRGLLGKVSTIRSQLGERLKADAVRLISLLMFQTADKTSGGSVASSKSNRGSGRTVCGSSTTERDSCC